MKASVFATVRPVLVLTFLLLASLEAVAQFRPTYPHKPEAADSQETAQPAQPPGPKIHVSPAQLQREIRELTSLTQQLAQDMDAVNRGMMPADTVSKLRHVEKLAKQMRKEIAP